MNSNELQHERQTSLTTKNSYTDSSPRKKQPIQLNNFTYLVFSMNFSKQNLYKEKNQREKIYILQNLSESTKKYIYCNV